MTEQHLPWWQRMNQWAADAVLASPALAGSASGGDLAAAAEADGITLALPQGDGYQARSEPDVFMGRVGAAGTADHPSAPKDTILSLSQALGNIYTWSREEVEAFQDQAIAAGLLDERTVARGARDSATAGAWASLVQQAADAYGAGARLSPMSLLGEIAASAPPQRGDVFTASVSNPDEIRSGVRDSARELTGTGNIGAAAEADAVRDYQAEEIASQRAAADAAKTGGVVTAPRSFDEFAKQRAEQNNPVGFRAHKYLDKFSAIANMLGGGNG